jgi:hypothetical protein
MISSIESAADEVADKGDGECVSFVADLLAGGWGVN